MDDSHSDWARDAARAVWSDFVAGRAPAVETFQRDGRCYLVLRESSDPESTALTPRERRVVALVRLGHSNKLIASDLGMAQSTVSEILRDAARKLGVRSRLELVRVLAPARAR